MKRELKGSKINLASQEGSLFKRTLLCRTGIFDGVYGRVTVDQAMLHRMAEHYNKQRAAPQNENDYAPVLLDHLRLADNVKGRLMAGLEVGPWVNSETGEEHHGLYGDLRIDAQDAIEKVEAGTYSQVSLSFDEETGEIYEVSFVAVEAARRSQVLAKGDKNMKDLETKYQELSATHEGLMGRLNAFKAVAKASCQSLAQNIEQAQTEAGDAVKQLAQVISTLKSTALASQFRGLVKAGKISLAEFKSIKVAELAALPKPALEAVLSAYESRPVNSDFIVHGQADAKPVSLKVQTPSEVREAIKLQKSGKGTTLAAQEEKSEDEKLGDNEENKEKLAEGGEKKDDEKESGESEMKLEDIDEAVKAVEAMGPIMDKISSSMKRMSDQLKKLADQDGGEDEKKEGEE